MLLAGRQCQHEAAPPFGVGRLTCQPAGYLPHVGLLGRKEPEIGATVPDGQAEGPGLAGHDVGALSARRLEESERKGLGHDHGEKGLLGKTA